MQYQGRGGVYIRRCLGRAEGCRLSEFLPRSMTTEVNEERVVYVDLIFPNSETCLEKPAIRTYLSLLNQFSLET